MYLYKAAKKGRKIFFSELLDLTKDPVFIFVTFLGNSLIVAGGLTFFLLENPINPNLKDWFDGIYWAFATVTTVGYGDIAPMTFLGKTISIFLMILGTGLFWTYAALFSSAMVRNAGRHLSADLKE